MKTNTGIIVAAVALIIGLGAGYGLGSNANSSSMMNNQPSNMHAMEDGHMMDDDMSMEDMMHSMNAELEGKTGDAFDQSFLSEMIVHHEGAVEMAKLALAHANHKEIKDLANAIISAQNTEISQMKSWQAAWYNQ